MRARRAGVATAAVVALAFAIAACGTTGPTPTPAATPLGAPSPSSAPSTSFPSASPTSAVPPSPAVAIDPALLAHLPASVDGLGVQRVPESDAIAQTDPLVVGNARAAVTALVIDPSTGEFAHATLVELDPGVFTDAFFREWRDTFDASVCQPAGGVAGRAESAIAGRRTFIDSCRQGAHTYHVWLARSGVVASVTSVGERRLGEKLVAAMTD